MALFDAADAAKCLEHSSGSLRPHGRGCLNNTLDVLNDSFQMRKLIKGSLLIWDLQIEKGSRAGPSFFATSFWNSVRSNQVVAESQDPEQLENQE
jgi:hypothetical protein